MLFARGIARHAQSTVLRKDKWEVEVTQQEGQLQQISVWHKAIWQQVSNYPLSMTHQLFGKSQMFSFEITTYHQLIHKLLSGQGGLMFIKS